MKNKSDLSKGGIIFGIITLITLVVALIVEGIKSVISFKKECNKQYKHSVIRNTINKNYTEKHAASAYYDTISKSKSK